MTHALIGIVHSRKVNHTIKKTLDEKLSQSSRASLDNLVVMIHKDSVEVLAMIRSAPIVSPDLVKEFENTLSAQLGNRVHLVVRNSLAKDVGATGGVNQVTHRTLDGVFLENKTSERQQILQSAEQILWELIDSRPDFQLISVDCGQLARGRIIFATMQGFRQPTVGEIRAAEQALRERINDSGLSLVVRFIEGTLWDRNGEVL